MRTAFIGLGIMGRRMAQNLLKNQVDLVVYNRSPEPAQELHTAGARRADSVPEAVREADIIFTMLSSPEAVEEVMLQPGGGVEAMKKGALWIDCSTVNPSFSQRCQQAAEARPVRFIDAPVAGSKPQAEQAELVIFAGGDKADLSEVEPLLGYMSRKVIHVGEVGKGTSLKMLVNTLLAESMLMFAETLRLGEKLGLSRDFLLDTLPHLPVSAPFLQAKAEKIRQDNYEVQFPLELMYKDLHLASLTAYENQYPMPLANLAKAMYARATQLGLGRDDFSAIYQLLNDEQNSQR